MRVLVLGFSLISIFFVSCGGKKPLPVHHVIYDELPKEEIRTGRSVNLSLQTYHSVLVFQDQEYKGKLYIKRVEKGRYKIAYTTETGFKLYAFEITENSINWEYCLTKLDNKIVKNILERDFRALLALVPQEGPALVSREERPHTVFGSENQKVYAYWTDKTRIIIYKSVLTNKKETLVIVHYLDFENSFPKRIKLVDHKSDLAMTLVKVN